MKLMDIKLNKDWRTYKLHELLADLRETERLEKLAGMTQIDHRINRHKLDRLLLWTMREMSDKRGMDIIELVEYYLDIGFTSTETHRDIFHNIEDKEFILEMRKITTEKSLSRALRLTIESLLREERYNRFENLSEGEREELKRKWDERKRKIEEYVNIEKLVETIEYNRDKPADVPNYTKGDWIAKHRGERRKPEKKKTKFENTGEVIEW